MKDTGIESPEDHDKIIINTPKENSAGIPAIQSVLKHVFTDMGKKNVFATKSKKVELIVLGAHGLILKMIVPD